MTLSSGASGVRTFELPLSQHRPSHYTPALSLELRPYLSRSSLPVPNPGPVTQEVLGEW